MTPSKTPQHYDDFLDRMCDARRAFANMPPVAKLITVRSADELRDIPRHRESRHEPAFALDYGSLMRGIPVAFDARLPHRRARISYTNGKVEAIIARAARGEPSLHDLRGMVRASERRARRAFWARDNETFKRESAELGRRRRMLEAAKLERFARNGFEGKVRR